MMSKSDSPADTLDIPKQVTVSITGDKRKQQWFEVKQHLANRRDTTVGNVSHRDVARELLDTYQFHRLNQDQRIREATHAVADDHNVDTDDVSLRSLLKITAGAYCGYQQTSNWRPSKNGEQSGGRE